MDNTITKGLEIIWKRQKKKKDNQIFAHTINTVLNKYNIEDKINHTHLIRVKTPEADNISLSYFNKNNRDKNKLAKIVENYIWDVVDNDTYLYHFTTEENAHSIKLSNTLRLYNIYKRYEDGEIKDFLKDFNIPYKIDENYKTIFYSSFTTVIPSLSDTHIIKKFRHFTGNVGARLKFKLMRKDKNLRYINYDKKKFKLIHDLLDAMKETHKIDLTINGWTTRLASFYVNEKYSGEKEVRLYKNLLFDNTYQMILDENNLFYIELDLNNPLLKLEEIIYESNEEIFNE